MVYERYFSVPLQEIAKKYYTRVHEILAKIAGGKEAEGV